MGDAQIDLTVLSLTCKFVSACGIAADGMRVEKTDSTSNLTPTDAEAVATIAEKNASYVLPTVFGIVAHASTL